MVQHIPTHTEHTTHTATNLPTHHPTHAQFEKMENKGAVIGYLSAAVVAFIAVEWLIHLPALDVVLGWPVQVCVAVCGCGCVCVAVCVAVYACAWE